MIDFSAELSRCTRTPGLLGGEVKRVGFPKALQLLSNGCCTAAELQAEGQLDMLSDQCDKASLDSIWMQMWVSCALHSPCMYNNHIPWWQLGNVEGCSVKSLW